MKIVVSGNGGRRTEHVCSVRAGIGFVVSRCMFLHAQMQNSERNCGYLSTVGVMAILQAMCLKGGKMTVISVSHKVHM